MYLTRIFIFLKFCIYKFLILFLFIPIVNAHYQNNEELGRIQLNKIRILENETDYYYPNKIDQGNNQFEKLFTLSQVLNNRNNLMNASVGVLLSLSLISITLIHFLSLKNKRLKLERKKIDLQKRELLKIKELIQFEGGNGTVESELNKAITVNMESISDENSNTKSEIEINETLGEVEVSLEVDEPKENEVPVILLADEKVKLRRFIVDNLEGNSQFIEDDKEECSIDFNQKEREFIEKLEGIIVINIANQQFGVPELAEEMFLSRSQLTRKLKRLINITPGAHIKNIRFEKAKQLLLEGFNVAETAWEIGFDDPVYFSKVFKKHFGEAPSFVNK